MAAALEKRFARVPHSKTTPKEIKTWFLETSHHHPRTLYIRSKGPEYTIRVVFNGALPFLAVSVAS